MYIIVLVSSPNNDMGLGLAQSTFDNEFDYREYENSTELTDKAVALLIGNFEVLLIQHFTLQSSTAQTLIPLKPSTIYSKI